MPKLSSREGILSDVLGTCDDSDDSLRSGNRYGHVSRSGHVSHSVAVAKHRLESLVDRCRGNEYPLVPMAEPVETLRKTRSPERLDRDRANVGRTRVYNSMPAVNALSDAEHTLTPMDRVRMGALHTSYASTSAGLEPATPGSYRSCPTITPFDRGGDPFPRRRQSSGYSGCVERRSATAPVTPRHASPVRGAPMSSMKIDRLRHQIHSLEVRNHLATGSFPASAMRRKRSSSLELGRKRRDLAIEVSDSSSSTFSDEETTTTKFSDLEDQLATVETTLRASTTSPRQKGATKTKSKKSPQQVKHDNAKTEENVTEKIIRSSDPAMLQSFVEFSQKQMSQAFSARDRAEEAAKKVSGFS
eukprot:Rmarinus@m.16604